MLFLFVVMLLNLGSSSWLGSAGPRNKLLALVLGAVFVVIVIGYGLSDLGQARVSSGAGIPPDVLGSISAVGAALYTAYYVPFIATGLLLLVAMVGAVMLVKRSR